MIQFKNNAGRLVQELAALEQSNRPLFDLLQDASQFVTNTYKKDFVVTMISRSQEEQDKLYKDDPKYQVKKFKSPHQFSHAADIRSSIFSPEEIKGIEDYLNNKYNGTNYYKWTARNHVIPGGAFHFHIQYVSR